MRHWFFASDPVAPSGASDFSRPCAQPVRLSPPRLRRFARHCARAAVLGAALSAGVIVAGPLWAAPTTGGDEFGPKVQILSPAYQDVLGGNTRIVLAIQATKFNPQSIELFVDGNSATNGPVPLSAFPSASFNWDTRLFPDGAHKLAVQVTDTQGFKGWAEVGVYIRNSTSTVDLTPPSLQWKNVEGFQEFSGKAQIELEAVENFGVKWVIVSINPASNPDAKPPLRSWFLNRAPFAINFDTELVDDGLYSLSATAYDALDQQGDAPALTIKVANKSLNATTPGAPLFPTNSSNLKEPSQEADGTETLALVPMAQPEGELETVSEPSKRPRKGIADNPTQTSNETGISGTTQVVPPNVVAPSIATPPVTPPRQINEAAVPESNGVENVEIPDLVEFGTSADAKISASPLVARAESQTRAESQSSTESGLLSSSTSPAPRLSNRVQSATSTSEVESAPTLLAARPSANSRSVDSTVSGAVAPASAEGRGVEISDAAAPQFSLKSGATETALRAIEASVVESVVEPRAVELRGSAPDSAARVAPVAENSENTITVVAATPEVSRSTQPRLSASPLSKAVLKATTHPIESEAMRREAVAEHIARTSAPQAAERVVPRTAQANSVEASSVEANSLDMRVETATFQNRASDESSSPVWSRSAAGETARAAAPALVKTEVARADTTRPDPQEQMARNNDVLRRWEAAPMWSQTSKATATRAVGAVRIARSTVADSLKSAGARLARPNATPAAAPKVAEPKIAALPREKDNATRTRGAAITVTPLEASATRALPDFHRVERTTTLRAVAARYGVPVELVAAANEWPVEMSVVRGMNVKLPQPLQVTYNGAPVTGDAPSMLISQTGVTAFRFLFERAGGKLEWDAVNQRVVAKKGDTEITLNIGSKVAKVGDREVMMELAAFLFEGRTMVPIRFFEEGLRAQVEWDPKTGRLVVAMSNDAVR